VENKDDDLPSKHTRRMVGNFLIKEVEKGKEKEATVGINFLWRKIFWKNLSFLNMRECYG
jgi:hypothetical protein